MPWWMGGGDWGGHYQPVLWPMPSSSPHDPSETQVTYHKDIITKVACPYSLRKFFSLACLLVSRRKNKNFAPSLKKNSLTRPWFLKARFRWTRVRTFVQKYALCEECTRAQPLVLLMSRNFFPKEFFVLPIYNFDRNITIPEAKW